MVRKAEAYEGHANSKVEVIDASSTDVAARVRELTAGNGADIVFNTVGDPYFEAAHKSLALRGRQILIAAVNRIVQFDILEFYRGQHTLCRHRYARSVVDRDRGGAARTRARLRERASRNRFRSIRRRSIRWKTPAAAFVAVAGSSRDRVILRPA